MSIIREYKIFPKIKHFEKKNFSTDFPFPRFRPRYTNFSVYSFSFQSLTASQNAAIKPSLTQLV